MQSNTKYQLSKKGSWRRWVLLSIAVVFLGINGAGLYIGNIIYKETSVLHSHLNGNNGTLKQILETGKQESKWEDTTIVSRFGYPLSATYIPNPQTTDKTLIFLHGFSESRAVGLNYLDIYLNYGFNLLLIDLRAHGESGGNSVTWGNYEKYDLDQWVDWVGNRPQGMIGVHGISMGAATALMHAELNEANKRVAFYIADSPYSDFETLLALQMERRLNLPGKVLTKLLLPYANVVAYFDARFTFRQASPIRSVRNITTPVLYIHGEADKLVPASMSLELYHATKGPRQIYLFANAGHVTAIFNDRYQYGGIVRKFVQTIEQPG
ncbi:alpha/beta hydrolase [Sporomusa sphaeroides]|uniref:Alpha/beta hydrolase family protein n=1 Tax=Sporomusa sphaeroides DSM 2875 TaxID=1337886 RepID=A0ABM9W4X4_9FIRM|nr:alpha/beta hydrolase [Sporomusa sphaeroides]OLS55660.1 alpha/beta hydrolase family protein [Sporomusa sphaeroides DSM 2875]CVK19414.1 Alpha/beta hydrolase family protein [Sporomusa sphaeroides DSM 2875]